MTDGRGHRSSNDSRVAHARRLASLRLIRAPESRSMDTPASNTGPLGQPRGIGFAILMAIITLGIYTLYWVFKTQEEVKNHSGQGVGGVLGLVIYIVVAIVTWFLVPSEVGKMIKQDGRTGAVQRVDGPLAPPADRRSVRLVHQDPGRAEPVLGEQEHRPRSCR